VSDPRHPQSLTNLASLYRSLGDEETAARYSSRIRRYNDRNPYYHYYRALSSFHQGELELAESQVKRALRLKSSEHNFHRLRGLIAEQAGDTDLALYSFTRAHEVAAFSDSKSVYANKIDLLTSRN
jgi:Flp pilus assembly protein TadD